MATTRKLAVFVEGQTELLFLERLLLELAGFHNITICREVLHGGHYRRLRSAGSRNGCEPYEALLVNCECDGKVKSAILERKNLLKAQGYSAILGLRDLYPEFDRSELTAVSDGLQAGLADPQVFVRIVLSVLEIEAWFLNEWTHLARISPVLTPEYIEASVVGLDLRTVAAEDLPHPATLTDQIYRLVGMSYRKRESDALRIMNALDFNRLYFDVRGNVAAFNELLSYLDDFVGTPANC